jgi:hypothetical protein
MMNRTSLTSTATVPAREVRNEEDLQAILKRYFATYF